MNGMFKGMGPLKDHPMYKEGHEASKLGESRFDCPYEEKLSLALWLIGHHDFRTEEWKLASDVANKKLSEIRLITYQ